MTRLMSRQAQAIIHGQLGLSADRSGRNEHATATEQKKDACARDQKTFFVCDCQHGLAQRAMTPQPRIKPVPNVVELG